MASMAVLEGDSFPCVASRITTFAKKKRGGTSAGTIHAFVVLFFFLPIKKEQP